MRYHEIPEVKTPFPVIGQGCGKLEVNQPLDALLEGIERGMTLLDTAEAYNDGGSEAVLGKVMSRIRNKVILATKVSPEHLSTGCLITACENSLKRLKTDGIDLYQIHWPNNKIAIQDTMSALAGLMDSGKIRMVGACNCSLKELRDAEDAFRPYRISSLQAEYNLFDRSAETALIPYCRESSKLFIAYSPLEQGTLVGSSGKRAALLETARRYGITPAQTALAWLTSTDYVTAVPKASKIDHAAENAAAGDIVLKKEDRKAISALFPSDPVLVPTQKIRVVKDGVDKRRVYQTVQEALDNRLDLTPSPYELAGQFRNGEFLKPVRLRPTTDSSGKYEYDLIEGRLRYWAWVIAHGGNKPIPTLIRH